MPGELNPRICGRHGPRSRRASQWAWQTPQICHRFSVVQSHWLLEKAVAPFLDRLYADWQWLVWRLVIEVGLEQVCL